MCNWSIKFCQCWDSNCRSLVSEATTLPTEPQPLPKYIVYFYSHDNWNIIQLGLNSKIVSFLDYHRSVLLTENDQEIILCHHWDLNPQPASSCEGITFLTQTCISPLSPFPTDLWGPNRETKTNFLVCWPRAFTSNSVCNSFTCRHELSGQLYCLVNSLVEPKNRSH